MQLPPFLQGFFEQGVYSKKKNKQTTTTMKIYGIVQTSTYDYAENV